jgi:hypothetical protein
MGVQRAQHRFAAAIDGAAGRDLFQDRRRGSLVAEIPGRYDLHRARILAARGSRSPYMSMIDKG